MILIDLQKALDTVDNEILLQKLKDTLSGLRQFLAIESILKMMKNAFYFNSKAIINNSLDI